MTKREQPPRPGKLLGAAALVLVLATAGPSRPDPIPLPAEAQELVNNAVEKGVAYLKQTQTRYPQAPYGTWALKESHMVGYTALPGLTLLECGVPATDDAVVRAANFVRRYSARIEHTYDIALAVLFLDRLGNPKDKALIQSLALRLVAGQGPTGGWGYKCPLLDSQTHKELLTVLRQLDPPVLFDPLNTPRPGQPTAVTGQGIRPAMNDPLGPSPGSLGRQPPPPDARTTTPAGPVPASPSPGESSPGATSPGERPAPAAGRTEKPAAADPEGEAAAASTDRTFRRWAWCLKMQEEPPEAAPRKAPPKKRPKTVVIPSALRGLPVVYDPRRLPLIEPKDKEHVPIVGRTDNSNTQFALLALWAARRHGVPATRSLNLIARRFLTSQNADGSWGYLYKFGGGDPERIPMTCVGLLGLAVGYGLNHEAGGGPRGIVQDPRVVQGFAALNKHVGTPTGRMQGHGMQNLYFLWSVERVGVLYNLAIIGNKDWYRWGAEILVANQQRAGNWKDGGYHGADATIDTCLALLFLRRVNLAADLGDRLPFDAAQLQQAITETVKPPPPAKDSSPPKPAPPPPKAEEPAPPKAEPKAPTIAEPIRAVAPPAPVQVEQPERGGGSALIWVFLLLGVLLIGGGILLVVLWRREEDEEEERPRKRKKGGRPRKTAAG